MDAALIAYSLRQSLKAEPLKIVSVIQILQFYARKFMFNF